MMREDFTMKNRIKTIVCAALGLALLPAVTGCGSASAPAAAEPVPEITVTASGTVRLVPDKAAVYFGVTTREDTAELAQSKNSQAVKKVMDVLIGRGIEEKSIRTNSYSMYPQYDWSENGEQRLIGYSVTTSMSVQDQDIDELGALLSACVAAGISSVDSVSFLCSGYDEAYRQALTQAVEASREKAEALALAAGKKLGDPIVITEGWQDVSARYGRSVNGASFKAEAAMDAAGPAFQPGESEIVANVTVTYRMQ